MALCPTSADKLSDCCQGISTFCSLADLSEKANEQMCTTTVKCSEVYEHPLIHNIAAGTLFLILTAFCFGFFQKEMKHTTGGKKNRGRLYLVCGAVMLACMAVIVLHMFDIAWPDTKSVICWAEFGALWAFGIAWIVSGKHIYGFKGD